MIQYTCAIELFEHAVGPEGWGETTRPGEMG